MGIIRDVITATETVLTSYPENVFAAVGPPLQITLQAVGVLSLLFVALNHIFNFRSVTYSTYIVWCIRYACIVCVAVVWGNFAIFRNLVVDVPMGYSTALIASVTTSVPEDYICGRKRIWIGSGGVWYWRDKHCTRYVDRAIPLTRDLNSTYDMFDTFNDRIFGVAGDIISRIGMRPSTWKYLLSGLIVYIIGIFFTATSLIIMLISKLGLAVSLGLAPLAISLLTFPQTKGYFESWLRLVVGFALVPLLLVSLMSVVITVANGMVTGTDSFFAGNMAFVLVTLAAVALLFQIPALASQLASAHMPQMGPQALAGAASRMAQFASAPLTARAAIYNRTSGASNAAKIAAAKGAGPIGVAYAGIKAMTQSSQYRSDKAYRKSQQKSNLATAKGKDGKSAPNSHGKPTSPHNNTPGSLAGFTPMQKHSFNANNATNNNNPR
jgi:type IV secretion system protein VirB6